MKTKSRKKTWDWPPLTRKELDALKEVWKRSVMNRDKK